MNQPVIQVKNLCCRLGKKSVISDVSVDLAGGESVLIAGKNGAGKSTFLRCLAGALFPNSGRIVFDSALTPKKIGFISDRLSLFEDFTIRQGIDFHSRVYGIEAFDGRLVRELRLDDSTRISQLSAGERVIFHLSLLLSQKPQLLLIDEIIHLMDPHTRELFIEALIEALDAERTTLVMVNHTFTEIERIPERVLIMEGGRFVVDEKSEDLRSRTKKIVSTEPVSADLPFIYRKETGFYKEYYVYPFEEGFRARFGLDFQDISLGEAIKAFIGGNYAQKRMA